MRTHCRFLHKGAILLPLYIYGFLVAMIISYLTTPVVKKLAWKVGGYRCPKRRKKGSKKTHAKAGRPCYICCLCSAGISVLPLEQSSIRGMLFGGACIVVLGNIFDDIYQLSAKVKLIGAQIVCALALHSLWSKGRMADKPSWGDVVSW